MLTGPLGAVADTVDALQHRDSTRTWQCLGGFMDVDWDGVDHLIVAGFYSIVRLQWPQEPLPPHLLGFVKFLTERYDDIVSVPEYVTQAVIRCVYSGDYRVFSYVPRDTLLTLQLLVVAAVTAHRDLTGERLESFLAGVAAEAEPYRRPSSLYA